ncbi:hypothetical protein [[Phormidium ambiguum] IAM M-71]|uniref:hypothetical protein n=1 Tax=[Phormidium ambiguum] IAM M-71 TaxID=454136 RepID=UPI000ACFF260|nr:hypothetical protein [Phormidium ambiguum]
MSTSPILEPRTISNSDGLNEFNNLFNNDIAAADDAALKLKVYWQRWATAFDAQWFEATENNAKILVGKKLALEIEKAKFRVAETIKLALAGETVEPLIGLPKNPVSNDEAVTTFYSIFKSQEVADKEVKKLVENWDKWAIAFGGQFFSADEYNAKVVAGRLIAKAIDEAKKRVTNAIKQAIAGKQISQFSEIETPEINQLPIELEQAKDRIQVYKDFITIALNQGANNDRLALLYQGVQSSPYKSEINDYPQRLSTTDYQQITSVKETENLEKFTPYPQVGELPKIDEKGLDFLHEDIQEACVCVANFGTENLLTCWLGRNAFTKGQFWSATKIFPILNVVSRVNGNSPSTDVDDCVIRDRDRRKRDVPFYELVWDVVSYCDRIASSNSLAAMFKRFETRQGLENWLKKITGNKNLEFRGGYGEPPYLSRPEIYDLKQKKVVLSATAEGTPGENLVTAYDLTRCITMLGWHQHLPSEVKFPNAQWNSLESIVRAMGTDACRYTDLAIKKLRLDKFISSPVIISKLGNGYSNSRNRYEIVYVMLIQFGDKLFQSENNSAKLRSFALTLRGASKNAVKLDARMAAEVTEIFRRLVTNELI